MLRLVLIYGFIALATTKGEHYTISRKANRIGDEFSIPPTLCGISNDTCVLHGANTMDGKTCRCECPLSNPTFALNGSNWSCHDDKKTKQNEGCRITILRIGNDFPTLDRRKSSLTRLHGLSQPSLRTGCNIDFNGTQYQSCESKWIPAGNITKKMFGYRSFGFVPYLHIIKANDAAHLAGRLIKLTFTTACQSNGEQSCLLLKIQGNFSCDLPEKKKKTISTTGVSLPTIAISTNPTKSEGETTVPETLKTTEAVVRTSKELRRDEIESALDTDKKETSVTKPPKVSSSGNQDNIKLSIIICATVVPILLIITAVVIIVHRHRKKENRYTVSSRPNIVSDSTMWNPAYGVNPGVDNEGLEEDQQADSNNVTPPALQFVGPPYQQYAHRTDGNQVVANHNVYNFTV